MEYGVYINKKNRISVNLAKRAVFVLLLVLIFDFFLFPAPLLASELDISTEAGASTEIEEVERVFTNTLPESELIGVHKTIYTSVTAYNSKINQCDDTPCITANNFNVCEHNIEDTVAANFLPFGTKVRFPEMFGDKVFTVRDRMNRRYTDRIDIWMKNNIDAKKFGVRILKVEILEEP